MEIGHWQEFAFDVLVSNLLSFLPFGTIPIATRGIAVTDADISQLSQASI
jgi:hypothetical protein